MITGNKKVRVPGTVLVTATLAFLAACHGSNSGGVRPPAPETDGITVSGVVSDGPVVGGRIFAFAASDVIDAITDGEAAENRAAALAAANPIVAQQRAATLSDTFSMELPAAFEGEAVFLVFDRADAEDRRFSDVPPNLESVALIGAPGSEQTINLSLHTTLIARIVRDALDPDGDGNVIDASAIAAVIQAAELDVLAELGRDDTGDDLFDGERPTDTSDSEALHAASSLLGHEFRSAAALHDLSLEEILAAVAADIGDGAMDGLVPGDLPPEIAAAADVVTSFLGHDVAPGLAAFASGPCSASAVTLRRACAVDVVDDRFEGRATCANITDDDERAECLAELHDELAEATGECNDVFGARLALCEAVGDAAHEPNFGPDFAANFVDPREIGTTVDPNPWLPLVPGTTWVYQGEFYDEDEDTLISEEVTVTVLDRIKLIDGIPCIVVNDVVVADDGTMEDTDDWLAQDVAGNVWYCGEISKDSALFEGDNPEEFELVAIEGSWKHGRDGAEAGILMPAAPAVGETYRQEVLFGEAEDAIRIESLSGTETAPGGTCTNDCLVTLDFTPLEPDVEENKYYAPGIGMIVEIDLETGDRLELITFTQP